MKLKKFEILNNVLLIFLVLQPFLDIYMSIIGERLDIFGISIATFIRTILIVVSFIVIVIYQIKRKEHIRLLYLMFGYLMLILFYIIAHHLNIVISNGYYMKEDLYNIITEIMYVERLVIPVILMYNVIITKPSKIMIEKTIVAVTAIVCLTIIITNLFKVSFTSYSGDNKNIQISYNFIDWFANENISYKESLSKGFFVSANQIGALLVILLPIVIYCVIQKSKCYLFFILFIQIIAMTLVGTRVASLGWILVCLFMIFAYIIHVITKKLKPLNSFATCVLVLILELGTLLYINSPAQNRDFAESYDGMYEQELSEKEDSGEYIPLEVFNSMLYDDQLLNEYIGSSVSDKGLVYDAMCKYIDETHKYHYITKKYINNIYPYKDDPQFWLKMFSAPVKVKGDNRARQIEIVKRIKENNDNPFWDTLLGMGATPMNNRGYMIENDIISHYYNLGIVGVLLFVMPYAVTLGYMLIMSRKQIRIFSNLQLLAYSLSISMAYFVGYFAGHVLDEYIVNIFLAVISATIYNLYNEGEINEKS